MNPIEAFGSIRNEMTREYNLPFPVSLCLKGLSAVHWVWWVHRKKKMIQPENIIPAGLGTLLSGGLKYAPHAVEQAFRGVGKLILIATRIDESIQRIKTLARAFAHFKDACASKFPLILEPQWIKNPESIILSAHTINKWKMMGKEFIVYMRRIYYSFLSIFVKIFKLSMQLWDTYHAFVFSHDAIPEIFVNGMYWFRKIRNNKDYLMEKLEQYQPLIQKILDATQSSTSADHMIKETKEALDILVQGIENVDNANLFLGNAIVKPFKKVSQLIKSKLLGNELMKKPAHTPFVLKKRVEVIVSAERGYALS